MKIHNRFRWSALSLVLLAILPGSVAADPAQPSKRGTVKPAKLQSIQQLQQTGWKAPYPPYPMEARAKHEEGYVSFRVATAADGKIAKVAVVEGSSDAESDLGKMVSGYMQMNWSGPPRSSATVRIYFGMSPAH